MSWQKPDPQTNAPHAHNDEKPDQVRTQPLAEVTKGEKKEKRERDASSGPIAGRRKRSEEAVDRTIEDTFPASDPPSFNRITGPGRR